MVEFLIYQAAWLQSILAFLVFVGFANGANVGMFNTTIDIIRIFSTMIATMACFLFADVTDKVNSNIMVVVQYSKKYNIYILT